MEFFSVGVEHHADLIKKRLESEFTQLAKDGINIDLQQDSAGPCQLFTCNAVIGAHSLTGDADNIFNYYIASALADSIVYDLEGDLLTELADQVLVDMTQEQRQEIVSMVEASLSAENSYVNNYLINRRTAILYALLDFLDESSHLNIEGFVRFRLQFYLDCLRQVLATMADEYLMEKEYEEFIGLLRYFVNVQEPLVEMVSVVVRSNGLFRLLDQRRQVVENDYLEGDVSNILDSHINREDLLISALITVSPARILLHFDRNSDFAETIRDVFQHRVEFCTGCSLCETSKKHMHNRPNTR